MELSLTVASVLGLLLLGAISPGPSFVLVARTSMLAGRIDAVFTAIGMGAGGLIFSLVVLLGLHAALDGASLFFLLLKIAGGSYLVYSAVRIWRDAREPIGVPGGCAVVLGSGRTSFSRGLLTQLSNPKTAVVYGGVFAALLPNDFPPLLTAALPIGVFMVEAGWYSVVALALSSGSLRAAYLASKVSADRVAGSIMGALGVKLIADAALLSGR